MISNDAAWTDEDAGPGAAAPPDQAEEPECPRRWRRLRRVRLVALLPGLALVAALVGSPFAGMASRTVDQPAPSPTVTHSPYR